MLKVDQEGVWTIRWVVRLLGESGMCRGGNRNYSRKWYCRKPFAYFRAWEVLELHLFPCIHYEQSTEGEAARGVSASGNSCAHLLTCDFTRGIFTVERGSTHGGSVSIAALDLVPWTRGALASPSGILTHWESIRENSFESDLIASLGPCHLNRRFHSLP